MAVDTNIFLRTARQPFPWEREVEALVAAAEIVVPAPVQRELAALDPVGVPEVTVARALARRYPTRPAPGRGDDAILAAALRWGAVLLTADRELQAKARAAGLDVLAPRDRDRLVRLPARRPARPRRGKAKKRTRLVRPS